jgi:hypothetical protein
MDSGCTTPKRMKVRGDKEIKEVRSLPGGCGPVEVMI